MPGMPGMPGGGKRAKAKQAAKKGKAKRGSGNPAKRAQQQAAAANRSTDDGVSGAAFGVTDEQERQEDFELPKELRDILGRGG
jgi:signal recognition particle subunit SRP54